MATKQPVLSKKARKADADGRTDVVLVLHVRNEYLDEAMNLLRVMRSGMEARHRPVTSPRQQGHCPNHWSTPTTGNLRAARLLST